MTCRIPSTFTDQITRNLVNNIRSPREVTALNIIFMKPVSLFIDKLRRLTDWLSLTILINLTILNVVNDNSIAIIVMIEGDALYIRRISILILGNETNVVMVNLWRIFFW